MHRTNPYSGPLSARPPPPPVPSCRAQPGSILKGRYVAHGRARFPRRRRARGRSEESVAQLRHQRSPVAWLRRLLEARRLREGSWPRRGGAAASDAVSASNSASSCAAQRRGEAGSAQRRWVGRREGEGVSAAGPPGRHGAPRRGQPPTTRESPRPSRAWRRCARPQSGLPRRDLRSAGAAVRK